MIFYEQFSTITQLLTFINAQITPQTLLCLSASRECRYACVAGKSYRTFFPAIFSLPFPFSFRIFRLSPRFFH